MIREDNYTDVFQWEMILLCGIVQPPNVIAGDQYPVGRPFSTEDLQT